MKIIQYETRYEVIYYYHKSELTSKKEAVLAYNLLNVFALES